MGATNKHGAEVGGTAQVEALPKAPYEHHRFLVRRMDVDMLDEAEEAVEAGSDRGDHLHLGIVWTLSKESGHWSCRRMEAVVGDWCAARCLFVSCRRGVSHMVSRDSLTAAWHMRCLTTCLIVVVFHGMHRATGSHATDPQEALSDKAARSDHGYFVLDIFCRSRKWVKLDCWMMQVVALDNDMKANDQRILSNSTKGDNGKVESD